MRIETIDLDHREKRELRFFNVQINIETSHFSFSINEHFSKRNYFFLLIFLLFVYYEIRSNHFQMLIEVLVIFLFQIQRIALIFVAKKVQWSIVVLRENV